MKFKALIAALVLFATGAAFAAAAQSAPPADLIALPRCVWGKLRPPAREPLLKAFEAADTAGVDKALTDLKAATLQSAEACSPNIALDHPTGDEVLLAGLRQEAAGDLINRDLKINRATLDRAVAAAPAPLAASLRKIASQLVNRQRADPTPALGPLYTALRLPAAGPANAKQASWIAAYAIGYHQVRVQAAYFDPTPKE